MYQKLRLKRDLKIHPAHGAKKGRTFLVIKQEEPRWGGTVYFIGDRGEQCDCLPQDCELFQDGNPECPVTVDTVSIGPKLSVVTEGRLCDKCSGGGCDSGGGECDNCQGTGVEPV